MAQSVFMKESEELAAMVQEEMGKNIKSKNRGVKQAGFHVLIGASMPNVLIEAGFLTISIIFHRFFYNFIELFKII